MGRLWRCGSCSAEFPEPGDRSGFGGAFTHARQAGHRIEGLVDADTGELLVKGANIRGAILKGFVRAKADDPESEAGDGKAESAPERRKHTLVRRTLGGRTFVAEGHRTPTPPSTPKGSLEMGREIPSPLTGTMATYTLVFPPEALGLFSMCREYMTREDGEPFQYAPEDVNAWVWGVIREYCEFFLPRAVVAKLDMSGRAAEEARSSVLDVLRHIQGLPPEAYEQALRDAEHDAQTAEVGAVG